MQMAYKVKKKHSIFIYYCCLLAPRKLEDSEAAEQYCAEIGRADAYMQFVPISSF